jgi:hypothetical protein
MAKEAYHERDWSRYIDSACAEISKDLVGMRAKIGGRGKMGDVIACLAVCPSVENLVASLSNV